MSDRPPVAGGGRSGWCLVNMHDDCLYRPCTCTCHEGDE
jgi:hypothetical protein